MEQIFESLDRWLSVIIRLSLLITLSATLRIDLLRLHEICCYSKQLLYLHLSMPVTVFVPRKRYPASTILLLVERSRVQLLTD